MKHEEDDDQPVANDADSTAPAREPRASGSECLTLGPRVFWTILVIALLFPTLLTLAYFVLLTHLPSSVQQTVYGAGKVLQFGFPAALVFLVLRRKPRMSWLAVRGVGVGIAFGGFVLAAMLLLFFYWLRSSVHIQGLELEVVQKVKDLGINSVWKYAATGVFYALAHSLLEEYYWRWFVFGQLQHRMSVPAAIAISSLGFMAHHIVVLATYFGWDSPLAYLFSLAVAIGGAVWAWIYSWSHSLLGPWLSHMVVDAAIFLIGFELIRGAIA